MRKRILCFIGALSAVFALSAQALLEHPEMYLGASAGVSASMVHFKPTVEQKILDPQLGITGGLAWRYIAERNVGIQVECNFLQGGWKEAGTNYSRQLNYAEVPLLTHIFFGKKFRGFVNLGPKIDLLVAETSKNLPVNADGTQYKPAEKKFDYGFCLGLGMALRTKVGCFQLEVRGGYDIGGIYGSRKTDYFSFSNNINAGLCLGWFWQVK